MSRNSPAENTPGTWPRMRSSRVLPLRPHPAMNSRRGRTGGLTRPATTSPNRATTAETSRDVGSIRWPAGVFDGAIQRRVQGRFVLDRDDLAGRRSDRHEPTLMVVDVLAVGGVARDHDGADAGRPRAGDRARAPVTDHRGCRSLELRQLVDGQQDDTLRVLRRRRGAVLDHDPRAMRARPPIRPAHQPIERMMIRADQDEDQRLRRGGRHRGDRSYRSAPTSTARGYRRTCSAHCTQTRSAIG